MRMRKKSGSSSNIGYDKRPSLVSSFASVLDPGIYVQRVSRNGRLSLRSVIDCVSRQSFVRLWFREWATACLPGFVPDSTFSQLSV